MAGPRFFNLSGARIVVYHEVRGNVRAGVSAGVGKYSISECQFHEHLQELRSSGAQVSLLNEVWTPHRQDEGGATCVVLTFDDGRSTDYFIVYPLLAQAGLRAEFFVNTATVGTKGYVTWAQMREMARSGMSFQSHGHEHVDLSRLNGRTLERQLSESKKRLEDGLGEPVDFPAVPYGLYNKQVIQVAHEQGYRGVCTSWSWPASPRQPTINRIGLYRHTSRQEFSGLLAGHLAPYLKRIALALLCYIPRRAMLRVAPGVLGVRVLEGTA